MSEMSTVEGTPIEKLARYEVSLDRKFERTLAMLLKFQDCVAPTLPCHARSD
jgi:hypothetical protein